MWTFSREPVILCSNEGVFPAVGRAFRPRGTKLNIIGKPVEIQRTQSQEAKPQQVRGKSVWLHLKKQQDLQDMRILLIF